MKLLIAIPALNEEQSIGSIIERTLDASDYILEGSSVDEIEITVVSDGSTDDTVSIAQSYSDQVGLIIFEQNRGYGAAILEAWKRSDAELVSFLDADGTCDPRMFKDLCNLLRDEDADVVLGCRLHSESQMPAIRRLGNKIFSIILSFFSSKSVRDTASGMRVVRRSSLRKLMPLPTGLHFTPAMSARALLRNDTVIKEIDMPYSEREGRSKLSVVKDGIRFLAIILEAVFLFRPSRLLAVFGFICFVIAVGLMAMPIGHYVQTRTVEDWMIYRFVVSHLLGSAAVLAFCMAYLSRKIVQATVLPESEPDRRHRLIGRFFSGPAVWVSVAILLILGGALVAPSFLQMVENASVYDHWSRFVVMSFFLTCAMILTMTRLLDLSLDLIQGWMSYEGRSQ